MFQTVKLSNGKYSRATMAQPQRQMTHSTSQHRSTSVLASLMRMRAQFQRMRTTQQQQIIAAVTARSSTQRLLGSNHQTPASLATKDNGNDDADDEMENEISARGGNSTVQTGILLCTEAQRLLKGEVRPNDSLSDVATSSPAYSMEAGKLLSSAAAFGASTTYPRVQEICTWIRTNADALCTTRQVTSLCTPLLSLNDGATAGVAFVLEVLYEPLLLALQAVGHPTMAPVSTAGTTVSSSSSTMGDAASVGDISAGQQVVAINSAFGIVAKWSTAAALAQVAARARTAVDGATTVDGALDAMLALRKEERTKMLRLAEASVVALARYTNEQVEGNGGSSNAVYAVLQQLSVSDVVVWLQSLHGLEKTFLAPEIATTHAEKSQALRRLSLCYRVLLPLMQRTLETSGGTAAAPSNELTNDSSSATSASAAAPSNSTSLRVQDVADLLQVGLFQSVEATHTELALRCGLQALPSTLGAATVREVCLVTQVVNKVRLQRPAALSAALVRSLLAALRPRLFLLRESQAYQLRSQDCSLLLSQLSRWEEIAGAVVSADIVELLCQRFGEQMPMVEATQLVPFVQAVARLEERHWRIDPSRSGNGEPSSAKAGAEEEEKKRRSNSTGGTTALVSSARHRLRRSRGKRAVRYRYATTARVVRQCAQRIAVLAARESDSVKRASLSASYEGAVATAQPPAEASTNTKIARLSHTDAAHLLSAFVQLSSPQVEFVFDKLEPILRSSLGSKNTVVATAASPASSSCSSSSSAQADLHSRVAVQESVIRFIAYASEQHPKDASGVLTDSSPQHPTPSGTSGSKADTAEHRAKALLSKMERSLLALVRQAARPKDVVVVSSLVRHRLLDHHTVKPDADLDDDLDLPPSRKSRRASAASASWSRTDVKLAVCLASRVCAVATECNGFEVSALAFAIAGLSAAGALPAPSTRRVMDALWMRCTSGLEAAAALGATQGFAEKVAAVSSSPMPIALTLDDCKRLMDATRLTLPALPASQQETMPPAEFLAVFASLCTEHLSSVTATDAVTADGAGDIVRGTFRSYAKTLADLRRYTALGRSLASLLAASSTSSSSLGAVAALAALREVRQAHRERWCSAVEAYLEVVRAAMQSYATEAALSESWSASGSANTTSASPPVPLELLSMTARSITQLQRLMHLRDDSQSKRSHDGVEMDVTDPSALEGGAEEFTHAASSEAASGTSALIADEDEAGDEVPLDAPVSLAAIDEAILEILGVLGDTIALLAKQQQQSHADDSQFPEDDAQSSRSAESNRVAMDPKHLLMLLQAFETARYRHAEMLYGILPELRGCSDQLDPLNLSLLIRALTQLGAWNSRLLRVLATAVEAKVQTCELRQCYTLLRGLSRSGCVSPNTFLELRGVAYTEWTRPGTRHGEAPQEPLQRLAEAVLRRLDELIRTRVSFFHLSKTASLADLVGVVEALRFFDVPPPPTYDAFVVLAVQKLVSVHTAASVASVVRHATVLLGAASALRQPAQQRVSVRTVWAVAHRVLTSPQHRSADALADTLTLQTCWQLWQLASLHTLRYGTEVTRGLFEVPEHSGAGHAAPLFVRIQRRLEGFVEVYAWGPNPGSDSLSQVACSQGSAALASRLPILSSHAQAALRRYGTHAAPSLVRGDRDVAEHLCFPLRLARRVTEQRDLSELVQSSLLAAPVVQAKKYVRLAACLLRADVWDSESIHAETQLLVVTALQALWAYSDLQRLLLTSPEAFSAEELVVLVAVAAHLMQGGTPTLTSSEESYSDAYHAACVCALRQLCSDKTGWRLATAVDAWMLLARIAAPPASSQLRFTELESTAELFTVLVRSGDVVLAALLQMQATLPVTRTRILPEILRLFQLSSNNGVMSFAAGDAVPPEPHSDSRADNSTKLSDRAVFQDQYAELQKCISLCLRTQW